MGVRSKYGGGGSLFEPVSSGVGEENRDEEGEN